jgi:hypothetical protein
MHPRDEARLCKPLEASSWCRASGYHPKSKYHHSLPPYLRQEGLSQPDNYVREVRGAKRELDLNGIVVVIEEKAPLALW